MAYQKFNYPNRYLLEISGTFQKIWETTTTIYLNTMKKEMPFDFILNYLPRNLVIQPAIGMFYIYCHHQIVLIARQTAKNKQHNGLWVATNREDHASLRTEIPALGDFVFDEGEGIDSAWLLLREDHDDFERAAGELCELISKRDKRIGRVTKKSREF